MKNLLKNIYRKTIHESLPVEDVTSHKKEIITTYQILGFIYKITYNPLP
jgi:hypothetical protein